MGMGVMCASYRTCGEVPQIGQLSREGKGVRLKHRFELSRGKSQLYYAKIVPQNRVICRGILSS